MRDVELASLASHMRELVGSQSWPVYRREIEKKISSRTEQLISINHNDVPFLQGQIQAWREMLNTPDQIIKRAKINNA